MGSNHLVYVDNNEYVTQNVGYEKVCSWLGKHNVMAAMPDPR